MVRRKFAIMMFVLLLIVSVAVVSIGCSSRSQGANTVPEFDNYEAFKELADSLDDTYFLVDDEVSVNADIIKVLKTISSFETVTLVQEDIDDVRLHYYGVFTKKDSDKSPVIRSKLGERSYYQVEWERLGGNKRARLDICIPKSLALDIDIATSSGQVTGDIVLANTVLLASRSANIHFVSDKVKSVEIESSTGALFIKLNDYESIRFASKSGGMLLDASSIHDVEGESSSGAITIAGEMMDGDIDIETSSGAVSICVEESVRHVDLKSSSGKIMYYGKEAEKSNLLMNDNEGLFTMKVKTSSGAINITK